FRSQLLITEAADRSAAAGVEAAGGGEFGEAGAVDRAQAGAPGDDETVGRREIVAALDQIAEIRLGRLAKRHFRIGPAEDPEALGRVQEAVRSVVTELPGQPGEEEGVGEADLRLALLALIGRDDLGAVGPGPFLLPDRSRFARDRPGQPDRVTGEGREIAPPRLGLDQHGPVALPGIGAAELGPDRLFLGPRNGGEAKRSLRREHVAVLPRPFEADALAGREAGIGGERARRPFLLADEDVHIFGAVLGLLAGRYGLGGDGSEQAGGGHRLAQIV